MIKLIATDMDGTLLTTTHEIAPETISTIDTAIDQGISIVLCTGRALFGVKPYLEKLNLRDDEFVIVNNGCSIHKGANLQLIDWVQLTKQNITYLYNLIKDLPIQLVTNDEEKLYVIEETPNKWVINDAKLVFTMAETLPMAWATSGDYTLFQGMFMGDPKDIDQFEAQYRQELETYFSVVRSQTYILEVMPKGTTKASALEKLGNLLHIKRENIMAIGDGNNDIEMLQYAGIGVAMANGTDMVKAAANYQTVTNDENGVAEAIKKYALQ